MSVLMGKSLYLSGPIQNEVDPTWRVKPTKILAERFGINVFDPNADKKQQWAPDLASAKTKCNFDEMSRIARLFVRKDMQQVQRADIVVAYLPPGVPTTGTHHEIINSWSYKNPTLLVSDRKEHIPLWYYGFIDHKYMFGGFENLYEYLREVDDGKHKDDFRWAFVYGLI
jgi:hypothetical protein